VIASDLMLCYPSRQKSQDSLYKRKAKMGEGSHLSRLFSMTEAGLRYKIWAPHEQRLAFTVLEVRVK